MVEIENYGLHDYSKKEIGKLKMKLYRLDQAPPRFDPNSKSRIESGVNRKGYFVREKRKRGKKGVKNYNANNINNNTNNNTHSDSSSSSDSEREKDNENYSLYIVQKRINNPIMIRSGPFNGCTCTRTCHCEKELGTRRRRETEQQIESLDLAVL